MDSVLKDATAGREETTTILNDQSIFTYSHSKPVEDSVERRHHLKPSHSAAQHHLQQRPFTHLSQHLKGLKRLLLRLDSHPRYLLKAHWVKNRGSSFDLWCLECPWAANQSRSTYTRDVPKSWSPHRGSSLFAYETLWHSKCKPLQWPSDGNTNTEVTWKSHCRSYAQWFPTALSWQSLRMFCKMQ